MILILYLVVGVLGGDFVAETNYLFAGMGLETFSFMILHNRYIEMNCSSYNDCYELLCDFMYQPVYLVIIEPKSWVGDCIRLKLDDERLLDAYFSVYIYGKYEGYFETKTVSEASYLLCALAKISSVNRIDYNVFDCKL